MSTAPFLLAVMGPTASGKSALAETIAEQTGAQLINADAFQVYRHLDIGTAKPTDRARYELLDILDPGESFGVGAWVQRALPILRNLYAEGRSAVVVGGTGFYIRALFEEYDAMDAAPDPALRAELDARLARDGVAAMFAELQAQNPALAARVDRQNPVRVRRALEKSLSSAPKVPVQLPGFRKAKIGIEGPSEILTERIADRVRNMVQIGWLEEIARLAEAGYSPGDPGLRAIGYGAMWCHQFEGWSLDEAIAKTIVETRQYAKRQRTWLKSEPHLKMLWDGPELFATWQREHATLLS